MSDLIMMEQMLKASHVGFHTTKIYSTTDNSCCGSAIWLFKGGHCEFDTRGVLKKVVTY